VGRGLAIAGLAKRGRVPVSALIATPAPSLKPAWFAQYTREVRGVGTDRAAVRRSTKSVSDRPPQPFFVIISGVSR